MSKQAWGMKRQCPNCGARFYDLNKDPIVCPKCQTVYEPEADLAEVDLPEDEIEGEEEEEVLEDASELGEDEDDVAEVIEKVDEGEER